MKPYCWQLRDASTLPPVSGLKTGPRLALWLLAAAADSDGCGIRRSVGTLAEEAGVAPRVMQIWLAELRRVGLLSEAGKGGGRTVGERRLNLPSRGDREDTPRRFRGDRENTPESSRGDRENTAGVIESVSRGDRENTAGVIEGSPKGTRGCTREVPQTPKPKPVVVDAHARGDDGGWPASPAPAMNGTPFGPNAPPTSRQIALIAEWSEQLDLPPSAEPRTKGAASKLLDSLRCDVERRRAERISEARAEGSRRGKPDYEARRKAASEAFLDATIRRQDGYDERLDES